MSVAIEVRELRKSYGATVAVDGIDFEVGTGEIFGMVGPNGAGKTTTIECLEGLRRPDGGSVRVLGLAPSNGSRELRQRIGVQLQESSLPPRLKVWEAVDLFAAFYRRSTDARTLIERLGLEDKRDAFFAKLSGGQKQRLSIALALVHDPEIVFLDELTTGLDPHARRSMWDLVRDVRERGKTVFLTTHFMEEAERLCDRVAILDGGRIVALDSPAALVGGLAADSRITVQVVGSADAEALRLIEGVTGVESADGRVEVRGRGEDLAGRVVRHLSAAGIGIRDLRTAQPTLEDVFLTLTGRPLDRSEEAAR